MVVTRSRVGVGGEIGKMLFKATNLHLVDKSWRSNTQHSGYSQKYYITNFKLSKRLDLNYSHHKSTCCIPYTYLMSYIKYISILKEKNLFCA